MSKEGYLLVHDEGRRSQVCYCVLGEGQLQFFSKREQGVLLRDIALSRSKLKIKGVPDEEARDCPYSFTVRIHRSKIRDGQQIVVGKPAELVLSAPSWAERKLWGNAIHAWQRNYWGEPQHRASNMTDDEIDEFFEAQLATLKLVMQVASARQPEPPTPAKAAAAVSRLLFTRTQSIKNAGTKVGKKMKIQASSMTFSLPPMGLSISSSHPQQQPTAASGP